MVDGTTLDEIAQERINLKRAVAYVRDFATRFSRKDGFFQPTEHGIQELHLIIASNTSIQSPGQYRTGELQNLRQHKPPQAVEVRRLMRKFMDDLNSKWQSAYD